MDFLAAQRLVSTLEVAEAVAGQEFPHVPGFQVESCLGEGGGGAVYLGRREGSDRLVAIKILARPIGSGPASRRAWRELDVLAHVRSPSIPRLLEHFEHGGRIHLVTEFVEGQGIEGHAAAASLDRRQRVDLLARVADAVQSIHEFGVIHRDLKPSNILIDGAGRPVVVDLGLALLTAGEGSSSVTRSGTPVGTVAFMAPEQARGERARVSTRSDVYSLGAIGYVLLTGQTPHDTDASLHEAVRRVAQDSARDPRSLDPSLPPALAAVLCTAAARDPAHRYATASEFAADLRRWLDNEPVRAGDRTLVQRGVRWAALHRASSAVVIAILLSSLVTSIAFVVYGRLDTQPHELVQRTGQVAEVRSRTGKRLALLASRRSGGVRAELVRSPAGRTPSAVVVAIVTDPLNIAPEFDGDLYVCDASQQGAPMVWTSSLDTITLRAPRDTHLPRVEHALSEGERERYKAGSFLVADIFRESPGKEIAVCLIGPLPATCVRVYTLLDKKLLFECWHWGTIEVGAWLERERVLVLSGRCQEHTLAELGAAPDGGGSRWPAVVLGITPRWGGRWGWINPRLAVRGEAADWYVGLRPADLVSGYSVKCDPTDASTRAESITLSIHRDGTPGIQGWLTVGSRGNVISRQGLGPGLRDPSIPEVSEFHLGPPLEPGELVGVTPR